MPGPDPWPAEGRRHPPRSAPTYWILAPLSEWLQAEAREAGSTLGRFRLLDVGCGAKPYHPFFAPLASEYVGVDPVHPGAELKGTVEDLPVPDASFDVVLCNQVLEHCADPALAVRELRRVTAPGGRVLASTHGVMAYHPSPEDLWRWTHAGLERLFEQNGDWSTLGVAPGAGTAACVTTVLSMYVHLTAKRTGLRPVGSGVIRILNRLGPAIDRRSRLLREPGPGTMFLNLHVRAEVAHG
ncbi:MAG: class I SAM-dependent methyltransferase [Gaiellaceae bacterium]